VKSFAHPRTLTVHLSPRAWRTTAAVAAAVLALGLSACGQKGATDMLDTAKASLEKNDTRAAIVSLKAALQANPNSGEARFLLGSALLDTGDAVAAGVELEKAAELKFDVTRVLPVLARALLAQGEHKKLLETYASFTLADPAAQADLKTSLAQAHAREGKLDEATARIDEAIALAPNFLPAKIFKARLLADAGKLEAAQGFLDQTLVADPKAHEAWLVKGDIYLHAMRDRKAAMVAYRKALEIKGDLPQAHTNLVELMLAERDNAGAKVQVEAMAKALPKHPQTMYFSGVMAYLERDYVKAGEIARTLVQGAPTNPLVLQLAGAVEYQQRAYASAETLLTKAVQGAPQLALARLLLAQTQLRTGQPARALQTLAPVLGGPNPNADVLAVAAEAHLANGDAKKAEELYGAAAKANPADVRIRTARALSQMRQGDTADAVSELQGLARTDTGITADMALISAHLRKGELDKALAAIAALEKKQPDKPMAQNLRGRVLVLKKDQAGAREAFERALQIDPRYFPAVASLAALDLVEKRPEAARARFDAILKAEPNNVAALNGLAALLARSSGKPEDITALLQRAIKAEPAATASRLRLVEHHVSNRDLKAALSAAQDGVAQVPNDGDLLLALGRVQLAQGETSQAVTTLTRLAQLKPDAPTVHVVLGEALLARKDEDAAASAFRKALELRPGLVQAQRALIGLEVNQRRWAEALALAREMQKQRPTDGLGQMFEGDIERQRGNADAAAAAYRAALAKSPKAAEVAVRLHGVLLQQGKGPEAERFAQGWQKDNPRDAAFIFHRADLALQGGDLVGAETRYRLVLELQPANALALNNVAWLMVTLNKPGALEFAEKANTLLPNQPALLDTLALAQNQAGRPKEAVETQKRAIALAPQDNALKLNLARLLIAAGDKAQARIELQLLEKLGAAFPEQNKVRDLLKSVNS
jgi:cellulose synthase operon protein C